VRKDRAAVGHRRTRAYHRIVNLGRVTGMLGGRRREPAPGDEAGGAESMPPNLAQSSLNALQVGVLVLDANDQPVLANPAAREMGLVRSRSDAHAIVRTLAAQTRRTRTGRIIELDIPRGNGDGEPLGVHVRTVDIGGGYVAVEAADVTEAHRLARVRRDFVANVSHELKTPVGALQLLAEALLDALGYAPGESSSADSSSGDSSSGDSSSGGSSRGDSGEGADIEAAARFAERIRHESNRLGRLTAELLELSRLQGADPLPQPEPVSVDRVLAEVIDRSRTPAAVKEIEVVVSGARGVTAYGNEGQLVTAVANLVENAIAYSSEGTRVEVEVGVVGGERDDDGAVHVTVRDQGIGIEPRDIDRIFERFYRSDRARSRATGGTGLGLAIVKHIATNHGGRVEVASTVGEGSTFTLRLPFRSLDLGGAQPGSVEIQTEP
jgi:two-component system, OmpR family, sensor histidine kinase SenX3